MACWQCYFLELIPLIVLLTALQILPLTALKTLPLTALEPLALVLLRLESPTREW